MVDVLSAGKSPDQIIDAEGQPRRPEKTLQATGQCGRSRAGSTVEDDDLGVHWLSVSSAERREHR
jgi:hypothetical protein